MNTYALLTQSHEWIRSDQVIRVYTDDWQRTGPFARGHRVRLVCLNGLTNTGHVIYSTHSTASLANDVAKALAEELFGAYAASHP